jgi:hypothetical protein
MFKDLSSDNQYIGSVVCLRSRGYSHKQKVKNDLQIFFIIMLLLTDEILFLGCSLIFN